MKTFKIFYEQSEIESLEALIANPDPKKVKEYGGNKYVEMLKKKLKKAKNVSAEDNIKTVAKNVVAKAAPHIKEIGKKAMQAAAHAATDAIAKKAHSAADKVMAPSEDAQDRCKRKADQVYGKKTSAYKSGAIVRCRKGKIWKKK